MSSAISKPFFLSFFLLWLVCCTPQTVYNDPIDTKIKGLVFTGPAKGPLQEHMFSSMVEISSNFVALVPEATVYRQSLEVVHDFENQWFGEKKQAAIEGIGLARAKGLKVMLKPHLVIGWDMNGWNRPELDITDSLSRIKYSQSASEFIRQQENKVDSKSNWRGEFMTKALEDWSTFERGYEKFILDYARIADSLNVEIFCIGTELKRAALEKPDFWRSLIGKVKEIYSGPLTYAANWDSYDDIEFWDELEYIGVDAYFPLSQSREPEKEELKKSWNTHINSLTKLSSKFSKPIIFTEWGYENEDYVAAEPWVLGRFKNSENTTNNEAQVRAYESMFEQIWEEPWMKGVFVWRWAYYEGVSKNPTYSPRNKEASSVLKKWFEKD